MNATARVSKTYVAKVHTQVTCTPASAKRIIQGSANSAVRTPCPRRWCCRSKPLSMLFTNVPFLTSLEMSPFWFSLCRWPCLERSPAEPVGRSVQGAAEGWANDAERLSQDPTFRLISSEKVWDQGAALTSRLQTFVTEMLAEEENFAGLAGRKRAPIGRAEALESDKRTVLDMDPTEIPVYGEQEQSACN